MAQHAGAPGRLGGRTRLLRGTMARAYPIFRTPGHAGNAHGYGGASCPWAEPEGVQPPGHTRNKRYAIALDITRGERERGRRSEEHTSELQSRFDLVCRLLLEKKK